jgi:SAM-dependent methyltransferase
MTKGREIWEGYWGGDEDHSYWERPAPEILEFMKSVSPDERPEVLDLGSGLGRHAIAFARAGFSVTAVDRSERAVSRLAERARELGLGIRVIVCDALSEALSGESFDIVLAYNVIYHGYRHEFGAAIERVRCLLKPGGLFYFTCPTRRDDKYDTGRELAPHTFSSDRSVTPGDMHYFPDEKDLETFLWGFRELRRETREGYWENRGRRQFYSNRHILAERE